MRAKSLLTYFFLFACFFAQAQQFVKRQEGHFYLHGKPYFFIGTNYWYGGLLGNEQQGKERIKKELDFLSAKGVTNLRILTAIEGEGQIHGVKRASPPSQPKQGMFNDNLLKGLDFLLSEMDKRNMKAVLFLSNNWEWSGGFLQYLNWNGEISDSVLRRKLTWDEMRDYVSRFYSCKPCINDYFKQVALVIKRTNTITGKRYINDPAIMSWELANEPRPMRSAANAAYSQWIKTTAAFIKSIDKNHLVTTGCEGEMGTESMELFKTIHADENIDYTTIHIWPKNWSWFKGGEIAEGLDNVISNTTSYIDKHVKTARQLNKPLVLEEFGLPRDGHSFSLQSATSSRDKYYSFIFTTLLTSVASKDIIAGANFWSFAGTGRPSGKNDNWWQEGDDWLGDPPMEEQGLNSVFDSDTSTWELIYSFSKRINENEAKK